MEDVKPREPVIISVTLAKLVARCGGDMKTRRMANF
jgi:hypothetical protein